MKVERAMGIEPMLVVWDTNKEWPLTGKRSRDLEGPFVADFTRTPVSAFPPCLEATTNTRPIADTVR
jgi:hypothetical protein